MNKPERIPRLTKSTYGQSYFKHDRDGKGVMLPENQFFEVNHRCLWQSEIQTHRLDFYMVFLVTQGEGIHTLGLREHYIRQNMLCFIAPDMVTAWQSDMEEHRGYFCAFSETFVNHSSTAKRFLHDLPFFQLDGQAALQLTDDQASYYHTLFTQMHQEYTNGNEYSANVLRSQLHVMLHKAFAQHATQACHYDEVNHTGLHLVKSFKALYLRDFQTLGAGKGLQLKKIAEYADELGVSQNHLNDTIKAITGRSAGQLIKSHLTNQATMCLMHAGKSISEIAYALGFEDPSYFARFYKSQTGKSPSAFRVLENL